jgi:hypothetical protein
LKDRFSKKTTSSSPRMLAIFSTPASCETGLRRSSGVLVLRPTGSDSGSTKKPKTALERASAAESGPGYEAEAEGGPDEAHAPGAVFGRGDFSDVGLGGRQGGAREAGQGDGRDQQG